MQAGLLRLLCHAVKTSTAILGADEALPLRRTKGNQGQIHLRCRFPRQMIISPSIELAALWKQMCTSNPENGPLACFAAAAAAGRSDWQACAAADLAGDGRPSQQPAAAGLLPSVAPCGSGAIAPRSDSERQKDPSHSHVQMHALMGASVHTWHGMQVIKDWHHYPKVGQDPVMWIQNTL